jgi:thiol-disulfide isomerase/thioredoxin
MENVRRGTIPTVGPEAFDGVRLDRPGLWAVAFLAGWCPYCLEFAPGFGSLGQSGLPILVADVTDLGSPLWDRFHIDIVPTILVFRDGVVEFRVDGIPMQGLGDADLEAVRAALGASAPSPAPSGGGARRREGTSG